MGFRTHHGNFAHRRSHFRFLMTRDREEGLRSGGGGRRTMQQQQSPQAEASMSLPLLSSSPRRRVRHTFTLSRSRSFSLSFYILLLSSLSPSARSPSLVRRANRRLFPLSTEQQPAIRRATPFCSLETSRKSRGEPWRSDLLKIKSACSESNSH